MVEQSKTSLVVVTALRFSPDYGEAALASALRHGEDVVLCLVVDRDIPEAVSEQLVDVGFLGEKVRQNLRETMIAEYRERGLLNLSLLVEKARSRGIQVESCVKDGPFVDSVLEVCEERRISRILVPRLNRSHLSRIFFGSEIDRLVRRVPCPVEIFRLSGASVTDSSGRETPQTKGSGL